MNIQSIRIAKTISLKDAKEKVKKMGFKVGVKPNPQYKNFHSFRQIQPDKFVKSTFRVKVLKSSNPRIIAIVGKLKP